MENVKNDKAVRIPDRQAILSSLGVQNKSFQCGKLPGNAKNCNMVPIVFAKMRIPIHFLRPTLKNIALKGGRGGEGSSQMLLLF